MDYAICQALSYNTAGLSESLVEYDVACQWCINFGQRLQESSTLHLPPGLSWTAGVGKFHLGTHQKDCFVKFSLNFIEGAGQQDGEILETLWAPLNKIAGSIRAMSKPARQEMIDDHMGDSNWKKTTRMGTLTPICQPFMYSDFFSQLKASPKKTRKQLKRRPRVVMSLMSWTHPLMIRPENYGHTKSTWPSLIVVIILKFINLKLMNVGFVVLRHYCILMHHSILSSSEQTIGNCSTPFRI